MALVVRGCVDGERRQGQGMEVGSVLAHSLSAHERMCAYLPQMVRSRRLQSRASQSSSATPPRLHEPIAPCASRPATLGDCTALPKSLGHRG